MAGLASSSTRCREEGKRGGCSPLVHPPLPGTTSRRPSAGHQEVAGYPVVAIAVPDPAQVVLCEHCDVASETGFDSPLVAADGERATGGAAEPAAHRRVPVSSWIGIPRERLMTSPSPAESLRFSNRNSTVPRPRGGSETGQRLAGCNGTRCVLPRGYARFPRAWNRFFPWGQDPERSGGLPVHESDHGALDWVLHAPW